MFTGLIRCIGTITAVSHVRGGMRISISIPGDDTPNIVPGDSISVDGVCLTAASLTNNNFSVDVSKETIERSTLQFVSRGTLVNIEMALQMGDKVGGHFVNGHVDGIGVISAFTQRGNEWLLDIKVENRLMPYIVEKGSIALDGISLTIAKIRDASFTSIIVPFTFNHTTLHMKKAGDRVNIETDIFAKYSAQQLGKQETLTEDFLKSRGF